MIARTLFVAALLFAAPTLEDCGGPPSSGGGGGNWWDEPQQVQQQQKDDGCPPKTSFSTPGSGTVVDVMDCPGLFNTGIRYVKVKGTDSGVGSRTVWSSNGINCEVGSTWSEISGC